MNVPQTRIVPDQPSEVPPVYCRSIEITNFRCFKGPLKISLTNSDGKPAQWTVILGDNGVGKTSVLQCLAGGSIFPDTLLMGQKDSTDSGKPMLRPLWSDQSWIDWLITKRQNQEGGFQCKLDIQKGALINDSCEDHLEWLYGMTTTTSDQRFEVKATMVAAPASDMAGFQMYGYGAGRKMALTSRVTFGLNPNDGLKSLFDDSLLANAEEWILNLDHLAKTEHPGKQRAAHTLESVRTLLQKVLPNITNITTNAVHNRRSDSPQIRAKFHHSTGVLLSIEDLSFGYQTMACWLVDLTRRLYMRYPESNNPLAEPAIVLIDEIDLHLHPKWQQSVMDYLSNIFINTQFIVTAHSPLIIQSSRASNIVLLRREGDHVVAIQELDSVREWRVDQILTSDLFGLSSVRPPEIDRLFIERSSILSNHKLTQDDEIRLEELNRLIHALPTSETKEMREVELFLKKIAQENSERTASS